MAKRRRRPASNNKKQNSTSGFDSKGWQRFRSFYVPLVLIILMIATVGVIVVSGYRKVTNSNFFDVDKISFHGLNRVSQEEVEKIVRSKTAKTTVWNVDLEEIRAEIEKLTYVKSAAISRVLPDQISVTVEERIPRALVSSQNGDFWVDEDARILGRVGKDEAHTEFPLHGWDETKTDRSQKENLQRVKLYQSIREDFGRAGISERVVALNLADMQDVQVSIIDSDEPVYVMLGNEDFGKRLSKALRMIEGKGQKIETLVSHGTSVSAQYRQN
jgi:cell division septal protein FtsQ